MLSSKGAFSQQSNLVSPIIPPYTLRNEPSTKKLFVKDKSHLPDKQICLPSIIIIYLHL